MINESDRQDYSGIQTGSPRPKKTYLAHGLYYELFKVADHNRDELRKRFLPFEDVFGYDNSFIAHDKAKHNIQNGGSVVFAKTLGPHVQDVGVVAYRVKRVKVGGDEKRVVDAGVRAVKPEFQKRGIIGPDLTRIVLMEEKPDYWIGLIRTWAIQRANENTGLISNSYPFRLPRRLEDPMPDEGNRRAQRFPVELQEIISQILGRSTLNKKIDLETGLCKRILPPLKSDRFRFPFGNARAEEIDYMMREDLKGVPEEGDAFQTLHVVDRQALNELIGSDFGRGMEPLSQNDIFSALRSFIPNIRRCIIGPSA